MSEIFAEREGITERIRETLKKRYNSKMKKY